mgnify:FL=1
MTKLPSVVPDVWPPKISPENGMPWWVRALYVLGVPAAIAIFLIYFVTSAVSSELAGLRADVRMHMRDQSLLVYYLEALCRNTAETDTERTACEPPR